MLGYIQAPPKDVEIKIENSVSKLKETPNGCAIIGRSQKEPLINKHITSLCNTSIIEENHQPIPNKQRTLKVTNISNYENEEKPNGYIEKEMAEVLDEINFDSFTGTKDGARHALSSRLFGSN